MLEPVFVKNELHSRKTKVHLEKTQLRSRVCLPAFVFTPWCVRLCFLSNAFSSKQKRSHCVYTGFRMNSHIWICTSSSFFEPVQIF